MVRLHSVLERVARQRTAALMGIVNCTPNSFYDGGHYEARAAVRSRVADLVSQGADIVDVGGESSKPGASAVDARTQIDRIAPALEQARELGALVSVDTASAEVAEYALQSGAEIINDVTCLSHPDLAEAVARANGFLVLSHSRGHQSQMPGFSDWPDDAYTDVVTEVLSELNSARDRAVQLGVSPANLLYDPGLGFSKNARHCYQLLGRLPQLLVSGHPWVIGTGRKSFVALRDGSGAENRLGGTIAASLAASRAGAQILRVHDVAELRQALAVEADILAAARTDSWSPC